MDLKTLSREALLKERALFGLEKQDSGKVVFVTADHSLLALGLERSEVSPVSRCCDSVHYVLSVYSKGRSWGLALQAGARACLPSRYAVCSSFEPGTSSNVILAPEGDNLMLRGMKEITL